MAAQEAPRGSAAGLVLANRVLQLVVDPHSGGIDAFVNRLIGEDYRSARSSAPELFHLFFRSRAGQVRLVGSGDLHLAYRLRRTAGSRILHMTFSGPPRFPVAVRVAVALAAASPVTRWTIDVKPPSGWALTSMLYPILDGIGDMGAGSYAVMPADDGLWLRDPFRQIVTLGRGGLSSGFYPSQGTPVQMALLGDARGGLYVAAEDPAGGAKSFDLVAAGGRLELYVDHRLPRAFGAEVRLGYPVVLGVYRGPWYAGADLYRRWAAAQGWTAPKPLPRWLRRGVVEMSAYTDAGRGSLGSDAALVDRLEPYPGRAAATVLLRWMGWEGGAPWNGPDVFPPFEGWSAFRQTIEQLHRLGVAVMVGLSAGTWTTTLPDYPTAGVACAKRQADGGVAVAYALHVEVWPGCPRFARRLEADAAQLARAGVDAIQLDALFEGPFDYSPGHGHTPGWDGAAYTRSMRALLAGVEAAARAINPHIVFASEGLPDVFLPYSALFISDAVSFNNPTVARFRGAAHALPLFEYLYHGAVVPLARQPLPRIAPFPGMARWLAYRTALSLQMGIAPSVSPPPAGAPWPRSPFASSAQGIYSQYASFLARGTMLPPPRVAAPRLTLTVPLLGPPSAIKTPHTYEVAVSGLLASAWRAPDGRIAVVLSNLTGEPLSVTFTPPAEALRLPDPQVRLLFPGHGSQALTLAGTVTMRVAAQSTVLVEFVPRTLSGTPATGPAARRIVPTGSSRGRMTAARAYRRARPLAPSTATASSDIRPGRSRATVAASAVSPRSRTKMEVTPPFIARVARIVRSITAPIAAEGRV